MPLRRTLAVVAATLMLAAGLGPATPTAVAKKSPKPWGSTSAPDQPLRKGCHRYRYSYRIDPPSDRWMAEIQLINRRRVKVTSDVLFSASGDPGRDRRTWSARICRASTVYGKHVIRMKVSYDPDPGDPTPDIRRGYVKNTRFRLHRP